MQVGGSARNDFFPEALKHALRAADYPTAGDLLEVAAYCFLDQGDLGTFLNWLKALPEEEIQSRPVLLSEYAWSLALTGRYDEAEQRLRQSDETAESLRDDPLLRQRVCRHRDACVVLFKLCAPTWQGGVATQNPRSDTRVWRRPSLTITICG